MAIDNASKRFAALNFGSDPVQIALPPPTGGIEQQDRFHLLALYDFDAEDAPDEIVYTGTLSLNWSSEKLLPCAECAEAGIVMCVNPNKVRSKTCPDNETLHAFNYSTIEGELVSFRKTSGCPARWTYTLEYNADDLVPGEILFRQDITDVFCKGCFHTWIKDLVGDEPYLRDDGEDQYTFVSRHGCEYPFVAVAGGQGDFSWPFLYGDGSDGSRVVSADENLGFPARNFFYDNLTIDESFSLLPYGDLDGFGIGIQFYQIFVNGTLTINGAIELDGEDGSNAAGQSGGAGAGYGPFGFIDDGPGGGLQIGSDGGNGETGGTPAEDGETSFIGAGGYVGGGLGGDGGDGGGGGIGGFDPSSREFHRYLLQRLFLKLHNLAYDGGGFGFENVVTGGVGGRGGGGGGKTGTAEGGGGGGGGTAGGLIFIAARNIVIGPNGRISANGGNGGNGANGVPGGGGDDAGGGGGGGAGGGGVVYLIYDSLVNTGTIEVNGGTGGSGGTAVNSGVAGEDGEDGAVGRIYRLNMATGEFE